MGNRSRYIIGISFVVGLTVWIVVGSVTGDMGLWVSMGTLIGLVFGAAIASLIARQETEG